MKNKKPISKRHQSRCRAMQALYLWNFTRHDSANIVEQVLENFAEDSMDVVFFKDLVEGTIRNVESIDTQLSSVLDRSVDDLNPVEFAVLRIAVYEFTHRLDVPYRVVINEAVEIAKQFGSTDGYKYVNGVLDKLAPKLREVEVATKS